MEITDLPTVNACLNSISTLLLTAGYLFIRRGQVERHRLAMAGAFVTSCVFLTSYLIYHSQAGSVPFTKQGWVRPVYFTILISHIILAAAIVLVAFSVPGFFETFIIDFLAWFSLTSRFQRFMGGVLALSPIVYYVSFSTALVFLTVRVIERTRWI